MSTPMLDNFLAPFTNRDPSPLYGKPLMYVPGGFARPIPGCVVVPPPVAWPFGPNDTSDKIAAISGAPFSDEREFEAVRDGGYRYALLNTAASSLGIVQDQITRASRWELAIVALNPGISGGPVAIMAHPNVAGVIVERAAGTPADYDEWRRQARKNGRLPIWFVFAGPTGAQQCAEQVMQGGFKGMGVTYSTGAYNDSATLLLPSI